MTLLLDFQNRYSSQVRVNASNPQNSSATTVDSTREAYAAADAQADFETICGEAYSSSNTIHVSAGVPLVMAKLLVYTAQADGAWYDQQLERLEKWYKLVLGRDRITPYTNSTLNPSVETMNSAPWSDPMVFANYIGGAPGPVGTVTDNPQNPQQD